METWEKFKKMKELLGTETLLEELAKAMGDWNLEDNLVFIARMYDLESEIENENY